MYIEVFFFFFLFPAVGTADSIEQDKASAVVYAYYRIGEDSFPSTTLSTEQFKEHIREIKTNNYSVLPLEAIITNIKQGKRLPPNTIAITFEGGHSSIMEEAVPLLLKEDLPFTIFISPSHIDSNPSAYIGWSRLKKLSHNPLVNIGLHSNLYARYANKTEVEIKTQLNKAKIKYREELGHEPLFFAYPYGEFSEKYKSLVKEQGYMAAFSQQSGVIYNGADIFSLPRFTMTGFYGDTNRFRLTANLLPFPATEIEPSKQALDSNPPTIGFTLPETLMKKSKQLHCFSSESEKPTLEQVGERRIEMRFSEKIEDTRIRINCTLPDGETDEGETRFRWHGMLFTLPETLL